LAKSGVIPSSVRTVHYSTEHTGQEDHGVHEWQLVRRPKWWRREKHRHSNSPFDTVNLQKHQGLVKFKAKLSGRCFNYLSTSHHRAQCRDPTVYWKCKKIGHISSSCASCLSKPCRVKGLAKRAAIDPPSDSSIPSTLHSPSPQAKAMDHRRSFGGGISSSRAHLAHHQRQRRPGGILGVCGELPRQPSFPSTPFCQVT
jgi:hypothetical protein